MAMFQSFLNFKGDITTTIPQQPEESVKKIKEVKILEDEHKFIGRWKKIAEDTARSESKRYRYYVCSKAQKQGWDTCPTKSLPAAEIEWFVIDRIRSIGSDPKLVAETINQANIQNRKRTGELEREQRIHEREMRRYNTEMQKIVGEAEDIKNESRNAAKLADLQDRIRTAEEQLTRIREEITALNREAISQQEITAALSAFDPVWESLAPREQARIIHLLVERIGYDGHKGTMALTFRNTGIKSLAQELSICK